LYTTNGAICGAFANIMAGDTPWDIVETRLAKIQALTKKDIDAVAKNYLDPSQWTTVKAGRIEST
jgi:predicted Zn-dependent peptidase